MPDETGDVPPLWPVKKRRQPAAVVHSAAQRGLPQSGQADQNRGGERLKGFSGAKASGRVTHAIAQEHQQCARELREVAKQVRESCHSQGIPLKHG